jgi:hypothetical protein
MVRGVDVLELTPTKFMTQNEIDAAKQVQLADLNVQMQPHIVYPMTMLTAKAYLDQLGRGDSISAADIATVMAAMDKNDVKALHRWSVKLEADAKTAKTPKDAERLTEVAAILKASKTTVARM